MGSTFSDLESNYANNCCGSRTTDDITTEIAPKNPRKKRKKRNHKKRKTNKQTYSTHLKSSRPDSIEPTEVESDNIDYTNTILEEDYTHKAPITDKDETVISNYMEPISSPQTYNGYAVAMEFMADESNDGYSVSLVSEKILKYDLSHTPSQPRHSLKSQTINNNVFIAPKVLNQSGNNNMALERVIDTDSMRFKQQMFDRMINKDWSYQQIIALISFNDKNNGIWTNVTFDPMLSQHSMKECMEKYTEIMEYKNGSSMDMFAQTQSLKDIAAYESVPKMVNDGVRYVEEEYKDEASAIWKAVQHKRRMLLKRESSKLVLSEKLYENMKEETLAFFLNGKKSLHLTAQNKSEMRGFMVGTEIVSNKALPPQINSQIRRVYYTNDNMEFVLSICEIDSVIGIYAYDLDTFSNDLLAKFPDFPQEISEMYFSLFYDAIMQQFHVLCGPKHECNGHIWCIYDIANKTNAANMIELTVERALNIHVCDGQRFILNGRNCMRFDENSEQFSECDMPETYKWKSMNDMLLCDNIVYARKQNIMLLFGGHTNALLWTDIWYLELDKGNECVWNEYTLNNSEMRHAFIKYKSMQCVLCFGCMVLIFIQTDNEWMDGGNSEIVSDEESEERVHFDTVYCLDLRRNAMMQCEYNKIIGFEKDIIVSKDNIIHCVTDKCHSKITALQLIPDKFCDFYRKQNTDLVIGYLRREQSKLDIKIKKIVYNYLPVL